MFTGRLIDLIKDMGAVFVIVAAPYALYLAIDCVFVPLAFIMAFTSCQGRYPFHSFHDPRTYTSAERGA